MKVEEKIQLTKQNLQHSCYDDQDYNDRLYNDICDIFSLSANETLEFQNNLFNSRRPHEHPKSKKKDKIYGRIRSDKIKNG